MLSQVASWWNRKPAAGVPAADQNRDPLQVVSGAEPPAISGPAEENTDAVPVAKRASTGGLLDEPELREFFAVNHFGLGRHNGAAYRTREALDRGRQALIARFQNSVQRLRQRREVHLRRLQDTLVQIEGVSDTTSRRVSQAVAYLERDQATLAEQVTASAEASGWVAQAAYEYESGFAKGLYEAVAMQVGERAQ